MVTISMGDNNPVWRANALMLQKRYNHRLGSTEATGKAVTGIVKQGMMLGLG